MKEIELILAKYKSGEMEKTTLDKENTENKEALETRIESHEQ